MYKHHKCCNDSNFYIYIFIYFMIYLYLHAHIRCCFLLRLRFSLHHFIVIAIFVVAATGDNGADNYVLCQYIMPHFKVECEFKWQNSPPAPTRMSLCTKMKFIWQIKRFCSVLSYTLSHYRLYITFIHHTLWIHYLHSTHTRGDFFFWLQWSASRQQTFSNALLWVPTSHSDIQIFVLVEIVFYELAFWWGKKLILKIWYSEKNATEKYIRHRGNWNRVEAVNGRTMCKSHQRPFCSSFVIKFVSKINEISAQSRTQ